MFRCELFVSGEGIPVYLLVGSATPPQVEHDVLNLALPEGKKVPKNEGLVQLLKARSKPEEWFTSCMLEGTS